MTFNRTTVAIVGGRAGGLATAASLLRRRPNLNVIVVEPRDAHYHQLGWTLVGGGIFGQAKTARPNGRRLSGKAWSTIRLEKSHNQAFGIADEAAFARLMATDISPASPDVARIRATTAGSVLAAA